LDIKDFILIGGGCLIALVVGHGFWIAWRAKREPLRMDIVPDLIPDDIDEMERLRGELPNGGARVVNRRVVEPTQEHLELDSSAPVLMQPAAQQQPEQRQSKALFDRPKKLRPKVYQAPPRTATASADSDNEPIVTQSRVADVELESKPLVAEAPTSRRESLRRKLRREPEPVMTETPTEAAPVEELLIVNLLAASGERFDGERLVNALRAQGLRYGDMNIFHRVDPATKAKLYSVANAVEPGTFDLSDLNTMSSPGMTFFLQLPGPDDASGVFDDMLTAARNVALELGGELRDEELSGLTGQTTEHMRQRIADFARRRLSKRA
jgi:cell division protein ZipA